MSSLTKVTTLSTPSMTSHDAALGITPSPSNTTLQRVQVPDVFVIPPEEEHEDNPPFCYFDAAMESKNSLSIIPDIDALDVALGICQQTDNRAPIFHRLLNESQETVVMPRRNLDGSQDAPVSVGGRTRRRVLDDSDVIEVVKVRKHEGVSNTPDGPGIHSLKKSKTFRARASQALQSIRNVGRNRKPSTTSRWPSEDGQLNDADENREVPRPSTPTISRRKSNLTQIFSSNRPSRSPTPDVPTSPTSPTSISSDSEWSSVSRPSLSIEDCMNAPFPRSATPTDDRPSLSNRRSFVRRISAIDIQRIFALSNPSKPSPELQARTNPSLPVHSPSKRESMPPTGSVALGGLNSFDDVFAAVVPPRPHSFHAGVVGDLPYSISSSSGSESASTLEQVTEDFANDSFELRLDSLHFDSLHFDPDEFVV